MRVFSTDASQGAYDSDIANGIAWAASHGAKVINLSLGATGGPYPFTLCNAVELAINSYGASVVAAAGNGNPPGTPVSTPTWPAACPGAIGVAATDSSDQPASFSNYGNPDVFVSAPGVNVLSTYPGDQYAYMSGTSMASPYVAGLVGLIRSLHPEASVAQVREILALELRQGRRGRVRRRPVRHVRGLHLGDALRLRPDQRAEGALDGSPTAAAAAAAATASPPPPPPPPPAAHVEGHEGTGRARLRGERPPPEGAPPALPRAGRQRPRPRSGCFVYRKTKLLKTFTRALRTTDDAVAYWVGFSFAKRGTYRYCVRASDAAGNHSPLACAAIRIR